MSDSEIGPPTKEELQQIKQEHGDQIIGMAHRAGFLIFKKPSREVWHRFVSAVRDDNNKNDVIDMEILVVACAVRPTREEMSAICHEYPALADKVTQHLQSLAGADEDEQVVKL